MEKMFYLHRAVVDEVSLWMVRKRFVLLKYCTIHPYKIYNSKIIAEELQVQSEATYSVTGA